LNIAPSSGFDPAAGMNETATMIMKFAPYLLGIGVLLGTATGALAKPAYATSTVNLRAAPGTTSEIVAKIPGGSRFEAGECSEGWCEVTWQGKSGFAIATALDLSGRPPPRRPTRPPGYQDGTDYVEGGPPVYYEDAPPVYYAPPPPYYGYYGPYYRGYGYRYRGWRRRW
jgi:uncharacterized protein YraI